jgi:hypothetical protein
METAFFYYHNCMLIAVVAGYILALTLGFEDSLLLVAYWIAVGVQQLIP